jgi:hypothetical protein
MMKLMKPSASEERASNTCLVVYLHILYFKTCTYKCESLNIGRILEDLWNVQQLIYTIVV